MNFIGGTLKARIFLQAASHLISLVPIWLSQSHNHIRSDTQENNLPPAHRIVWTVVIMAEARPLARPIRQSDDAFQNIQRYRPPAYLLLLCILLYLGILRVNGRVIPVRLWCLVYQYFLSTLSSVISSLDKPKAKY